MDISGTIFSLLYFRFALCLHSASASFRACNQAENGCLALANSLRLRLASRGRCAHGLRPSKQCSEFGRQRLMLHGCVLTSFRHAPILLYVLCPAHPPSIMYLLSLTLSIVARALAPAVKGNTSYGMAFSLTACSPPEKSIFSVTARELLYRKLSLTVSAGKNLPFPCLRP